MVYMFDIDGTICNNTDGKYEDAIPMLKRIAVINQLYNEGHTIKLYTARGATTGIDWTELTVSQMKEWGVKHHTLMLGKPHYDIFIDDKAVSDKRFFERYSVD